jgi:ferredoxin-NADP reductase
VTAAATPAQIPWREAVIEDAWPESARARTLRLHADGFPAHDAGQHVDVRLTAEDGYQVQRSYSIASAPRDDGRFEITVERIEEGEVSPFLIDIAVVGDVIEARGPIGGYFVWRPDMTSSVLLAAGGSGIAPLMSIARQRRSAGNRAPMRLIYSARTEADILYGDEVRRLSAAHDGFEALTTLTRSSAADWSGLKGRISGVMLRELGLAGLDRPSAYVCGPTSFVEFVAAQLVQAGLPAVAVKTERFGPSGGT